MCKEPALGFPLRLSARPGGFEQHQPDTGKLPGYVIEIAFRASLARRQKKEYVAIRVLIHENIRIKVVHPGQWPHRSAIRTAVLPGGGRRGIGDDLFQARPEL